ncbi:rhomboid family intramembrane serine protease [Roseivivax sediminis]|uniref:Membrane associated serine protease, rhomboid family n=1 Tax=Roseivivax sediminis TaxID=936889 RepID=A0A1I1W2B7_9RHOB|nr:rhomboid family intramembrane serine protease [Roseivivax sediminis]SFD89332.1 Membrane associated serine protease, rhomboid family [Roseivivax sediminis]
MHDHNASPVNPLPPVVLALFAILAVAELAFSLGARGLMGGPGAIGWRVAMIERFAYAPEILDWMVRTRQLPPEHLARIVTYPFVNGAFTATLFAGVMLLALGKMVAEAIGQPRTLAVFLGAAIGGALIYTAVLPGGPALYGSFPPVYGLIGAFTYLLWVRLGQAGEAQIRAFTLIGVLLGIQLVFGLLFGGGPFWVAEIGGFLSGFGLAVLLVPGGARRLLHRIRR